MKRNWPREIWDAKWYLLLIAAMGLVPLAGLIMLLALAKFAILYLFGK